MIDYEVEIVDHFCTGDQDCVHFWFEEKLYVYYFEMGASVEDKIKEFIKNIIDGRKRD